MMEIVQSNCFAAFSKATPSIREENKNVPQALENVVIKATAKN